MSRNVQTVAGPVDLSGIGQGGVDPRVAMNAHGDAVVVWVSGIGAGVVQATVRSADGTFSVPVNVSLPGRLVASPQVAINQRGEAITVWEQSGTVMAASRPAGGTFSSPVDLSGGGQTTTDPHVALDEAGHATAVWQRGTGIQAIARAGTSFGSPINLTPAGQNASYPRLAMAGTGDAAIAWQLATGRLTRVQATIGRAGGGFGRAVTLSSSGSGPEVAADQAGDAVIGWTDNGTVRAAVRSAGGRFGAGATVAAGDEPQVAIAGREAAILIWNHRDASGSLAVQESDYAPAATIAHLKIAPHAFAAANHGPSIARATGARVSYTDTQPSTTTFSILRPRPGVSIAGRCVKPTSHTHGPRCIRWVNVGSFSRHDHVGSNSFRFTGRLDNRKLTPGGYRLQAVPRNNGRTGPPAAAAFHTAFA